MSDHQTISVRKVDKSLWRQFGVRAKEQGSSITALLQSVLKDWLRVRRETRRDR